MPLYSIEGYSGIPLNIYFVINKIIDKNNNEKVRVKVNVVNELVIVWFFPSLFFPLSLTHPSIYV